MSRNGHDCDCPRCEEKADLAMALHREQDGLRRIESLAEKRDHALREADALRAELARVTAERDALRGADEEVERLKALASKAMGMRDDALARAEKAEAKEREGQSSWRTWRGRALEAESKLKQRTGERGAAEALLQRAYETCSHGSPARQTWEAVRALLRKRGLLK